MFYFCYSIYNWILNCCQYKKKQMTEDDIKEEALILLNKWKVDCYSNNRFLHKIPKERSLQKYKSLLA